MVNLVSLLLSGLLISPAFGSQARSEPSAPTTFHSVFYVEVDATASAKTMVLAALKQYRNANAREDGFENLELFEQAGRPGHYAGIETWRDQQAFDKRTADIQKQFLDTIKPIRLSDLDRRPYKTLTVNPASGTVNGQTVFVITHVDVSPSPQVALLLQRHAEESRKDEGNLRFDVFLHTMRSNHFTVIEAWRNRKALDAHVSAAHTRQYREALGPMLGSPLDERLFDRIQP
jgi:quinol monooxygenase YgiN